MIKHNRKQLIKSYMDHHSSTYEEAEKAIDKYLNEIKKARELAKKNPLRKFTTYAGDFTITDENGNRVI